LNQEVKLVTTLRARGFVLKHGGRLYVWADTPACCGGTRFIEAWTEPPVDAERFLRAVTGDVEVFVRPAGPDRFPDELHVDLGGTRGRRVRAYWNGCPSLV